MSVHNEQVAITSPCPIRLDRSGVKPEDRAMHCAHCVKDVHILSNMSEVEAREFLAENEGADICVSYKIKEDGGIRFRPDAANSCPPPARPALVPITALSRRKPRKSPSRVAAFASTVGAVIMLAACAPHSVSEGIELDADTQLLTATNTQPIIPTQDDVPCEAEDIPVDGGITAQLVTEPTDIQVAGGIRPMPVPHVEPALPPKTAPVAEPPQPVEHAVRGRVAPVAEPAPLEGVKRIGG